MLTCLLLLLSSSLFAVQFCINKFFQLYKPPGNASSALFALFGKVAAVVVFFFCVLLSGTTFWENGYTVLAGVAQAFLNLAVTVNLTIGYYNIVWHSFCNRYYIFTLYSKAAGANIGNGAFIKGDIINICFHFNCIIADVVKGAVFKQGI